MEELQKYLLSKEELEERDKREAKRKKKNGYYRSYNKACRVRISLNFDRDRDSDVVEAIRRENPDNIQDAVKSIIRRVIASDKAEDTLSNFR